MIEKDPKQERVIGIRITITIVIIIKVNVLCCTIGFPNKKTTT